MQLEVSATHFKIQRLTNSWNPAWAPTRGYIWSKAPMPTKDTFFRVRNGNFVFWRCAAAAATRPFPETVRSKNAGRRGKCEILTRCYAFKMRLFLAGFFLLLSSRSSFKTKEKKNLFLSRWRRSTQFFAHRHKLSPVAAWIIKAWAQAARITELG